MPKEQLIIKTRYANAPAHLSRWPHAAAGFSIVEVILSGAILVLLAGTVVGAVLGGELGVVNAGARNRATLIAEEGIEALRSIGRSDFSVLAPGTYGVVTSTGAWALIATPDTMDTFTRTVQLTGIDANRTEATVTVTWPISPVRTGAISLTTRLTKWSASTPEANNFVLDFSAAVIQKNKKDVTGMVLENNGENPITLDKMAVTNTSHKVAELVVNGVAVWVKQKNETAPPPGTVIDVTNVEIPAGGSVTLDRLTFDSALEKSSFTAVFIMSDGSQKSVDVSL